MNRVLALGPGAPDMSTDLLGTSGTSVELIGELPSAPPLPFETGTFDLIVAYGAFSAAEGHRAEWLAEIDRLLAPEGRVLLGASELAAVTAEAAAQRARVEEQRLEFDRELKRKAFRIAELELGRTPTPSYWANAERVSAEYEATLSWRVTRPLRAAKRILSRS